MVLELRGFRFSNFHFDRNYLPRFSFLCAFRECDEIILTDLSQKATLSYPFQHSLKITLRVLSLDSNNFKGGLDLTRLPSSLTEVSVSRNNFSGCLNLQKLPKGLKVLKLSNNFFEGRSDFSKLPTALKELDVSNTNLSGDILLEKKQPEFEVDNSNVRIYLRWK